MKAEELIPGEWYFGENHKDFCKYFMFLKHSARINKDDNRFYTIQSIDGKQYFNFYSSNEDYRKMTPEEKLKML